jgi:hypothetical protein
VRGAGEAEAADKELLPPSDRVEAVMRALRTLLMTYGLPGAFYTDRAH